MARSSRSKGSVSVDLFNLPTLPDERRVATSYLDIPVDFYLPDGKNSKISKVISRQAFDRQTPDGNEGFVIEIQYLKRAFCTNIYLIDKVTGSLFAVHTTTTSNLQDFVVVSVYSIYRNWSLTYVI